jgi:DNA polymerase III delta prime subunit
MNIPVPSKKIQTDQLWLEKYRPLSLRHYLDYQRFKSVIEEYINPIKKRGITFKPFLILYGNPGVGKTSLAHCLYNDYLYDKIECNASETRTKKILSELINTGKNSVIFSEDGTLKKPGIIMDEIDGISTGENNGIKTLLEFTILDKFKKGNKLFNDYNYSSSIKKGVFQYKVRYPVICTTNSIKEKKLKPILDLGILIRVYHPTVSSLLKLAKKINSSENLKINNSLLEEIINICKPEYRCVIIFLHEIFLFRETLDINLSSSQKKQEQIKFIKEKITQYELNNQLSQYVNLPIQHIVSNLITHYPLYLKHTYNLINSGLDLDNKEDNKIINLTINKINNYKYYYNNELTSLIQVDNNLINYNILENVPKIIQEICNAKLLELKQKTIPTKKKRELILSNFKTALKLLTINNDIMTINNTWREFIEINKEWDLQDYSNSLLVFLVSIINQYNYYFGKKNKSVCHFLDTKYHTKYNNMKQYLGIMNNQIKFHHTDIKGNELQNNLIHNINAHTYIFNKNAPINQQTLLYQGNTKKLETRNYFNVKQHLISSNINYFYMYYQNDNNNKESYDKTFEAGLNKINKIMQEIIS